MEAVSPDGGPAVVVRLNPLCRSVPTTVELSFGVREENSEDKCLPLQNVTATILPGASVLLPVNVTALPLEHGQKYCFTVLDHNIKSGTDRYCVQNNIFHYGSFCYRQYKAISLYARLSQ